MAITPDQLSSLADSVPDLDKQAQTQAQAARRIQLQQAMAAAPTGPTVNPAEAAGQLAAANTQAQATQAVQAAQTEQQQLGAVASTALAGAADTQQTDQAARETAQQVALTKQAATQQLGQSEQDIAARKVTTQAEIDSAARLQQIGIQQDTSLNLLTLKQREDVAKLGRDVKQQLFDSRLMFTQDESGRKFTNERQLADYMVSTAQSEQDLKLKFQQMQQTAARQDYLLKAANQLIQQKLQQASAQGQQAANNLQQEQLLGAKQGLDRQIARDAATAQNRAMIANGAGAVVGGIFGGPVGAKFGGGAASAALGAFGG